MIYKSIQPISIGFSINENIRSMDDGLSISGYVKKKGISIPCRVRLFEKISGNLISDTQTDINGFYKFSHLQKAEFFIIAHDPVRTYNAVIQDMVKPK